MKIKKQLKFYDPKSRSTQIDGCGRATIKKGECHMRLRVARDVVSSLLLVGTVGLVIANGFD